MRKRLVSYAMFLLVFLLMLIMSACNSSEAPNSIDKELNKQEGTNDSRQNDTTNIDSTKPNLDDETQQPEPLFPLKSYSGQLGEQVTFDFENISKITVKDLNSSNDKEPIELNEQYIQYIRQNLYWLDFEAAEVNPSLSDSQPILVSLYVNNEAYELTYDLELNAYKLGEHYYYAEHKIAQMMQHYFNPSSKLAILENLQLNDYLEYSSSYPNDPDYIDEVYEHQYEYERLNINGLDYHGWDKLLNEHPASETIFYEYNTGIDAIAPILYNEELDLLFSGDFYFFSDEVETSDGVKVGLSKDEVLKKLGKPNYEPSSTRWSYYIGDNLKFHLYFENDTVVVMSLTMPL